ncbi:MAG: 50S ribosomal protein L21 [Phycisphaerae bacterium]|jgi:large subunit ribosomal protein L21
MYAIIEESGSQRKVVTGDVISVDLLGSGQATIGQAITFDKVLVVGEVGGSAKVGAPYVAGATVKGEVVTPDVKGEKLYIQKFQAKKTWQKKTGHRQHYTLVKVTAITA